MYNNFDYLDSVQKIKSALYDIYESQEVMIGEEQDENKRNNRVQNYIETKDLAVKLLERIESLYQEKTVTAKGNDSVPNEEKKDEPQIIQITKQDELLKESNQIEDVSSSEVVDVNSSEFLENEELSDDESEVLEEDEEIAADTKLDELPRFHLDSRNGDKPNFAFVPESIFSKLKANGILELLNNKIYKQDDSEKRGIIVRKDQFMKLSLSKDRQEGILREARQFRIEQARKSRQKLQEVEV